MGNTRRNIAGLVALLLVTAASANAEDSTSRPLAAVPVVEAAWKDSAYVAQGRFEVAAPRELVWSVLSDYEHVGDFVSSVRKSVVRLRRPDFLYVEQEAEEQALFIKERMHVLLRIQEQPGESITFRDISQRDFKVYEGSWRVEAVPGGSRVTYSLRADPKLPVPGFVAVPTFKNAGARLLGQVQAEIRRRSQTQKP